MDSKKSTLIIIVIAALVIGAGAAVALMPKTQNNLTTTEATTVTQSEAAESTTAAPKTQSTTESTTTEETSAEEDNSFLYKGIWYYFDDAKREAYAFQFTDDDDVTVSYFDESNVDGEDAKFFTGKADYKVENGVLLIDDLPSSIPEKAFVFKVKDNVIFDENNNKLELQNKNKASVELPYDHFNP